MEYNLLNPHEHLQKNYLHQLKHTIDAYNPTQIVLGEALQNAIDAIVETDDGNPHEININLDLDQRAITITDTGSGFPNDPSLLFLGGGTKDAENPKLFGAVGVGIKVVLFSSEEFRIQANSDNGVFRYEISNAYKFNNDPLPDLKAPNRFEDDPSPVNRGTAIYYRFPNPAANNDINRIEEFIQNMYDHCLPKGKDQGFGKTLKSAVEKGFYENRFAGLMDAFLRRYTYASDVLNCLGEKPELSNTTIHINVRCTNPRQDLGDEIGDLFDEKTEFSLTIYPKYLLFSDTSNWAPQGTNIGSSSVPLGPGGTNLHRAARNFNILFFRNVEDYKKLLLGRNEDFPSEMSQSIEEYETKLFPKINGIILTICRIPLFDNFLPGGSQRVISANGIVTTHSFDLTKGQNQQYVRCFDLIVDMDATLNYGKSQITDRHLVRRIKNFVNDAYGTTIQTAALNWVGRIRSSDNDGQLDSFLNREDLSINQLATKKVPKDENDVIALFFELLGRGYLEGYQNFGLSQHDRYDGRFVIRRSENDDDSVIPTDDGQLSIVEFKVRAGTLLTDFADGTKDPRDLKLVIAWEEGTSSSAQFYFENIEYSNHHANNVYPGVTRYLEDTMSGSEIQVLLLKSVVDRIREQEEE